jgi:hypothetical protein
MVHLVEQVDNPTVVLVLDDGKAGFNNSAPSALSEGRGGGELPV